MGRLGHLALHIEVKDQFRAAGPFLGQTPPAAIAGPRRAVARRNVSHEINVGMILVGRPMTLKIIEEGWQLTLPLPFPPPPGNRYRPCPN